ncbi:MAG: HAD family hydrolase [Deltaproteobacteria bacterium]|nr:HAD family hydrolase [Deltaproteobacteria bacterium]
MKEILELTYHIFDLDDTLINTRFAYFLSQRKALEEIYPDSDQDDLIIKINRLKKLTAHFSSAFPKEYFKAFLIQESFAKNEIEKKTERLLRIYEKVFWENLTVFEGVFKYLDLLAKQKKQLFIISNGNFENQMKKMRLTKLNSYFPKKNVYVSSRFKPDQKKPSPFIILKLMEIQTVNPSQAIYYGNSVSDIISGNLAGIKTLFMGDKKLLKNSVEKLEQPDYKLSSWKNRKIQRFEKTFDR